MASSWTEAPSPGPGQSFRRDEGVHSHQFTWLPFESLSDAYFYPIFLKKEIFHLPEAFALRTEVE